MKYELPQLSYSYNALEPYIDETTMKIHHTKHHQAYVDNLNNVLENHEDLQGEELTTILSNLDSVPKEIRQAVRNHGGGHYNHDFFWKILKKDVELKGEIAEAINKIFSSEEAFRKAFLKIASGVFGSGWTWLVVDSDKQLEIMPTSNQDAPISKGKIPIIALDVWEHAYYLKYQNRRADYAEAFFKVINWEQVNANYIDALK